MAVYHHLLRMHYVMRGTHASHAGVMQFRGQQSIMLWLRNNNPMCMQSCKPHPSSPFVNAPSPDICRCSAKNAAFFNRLPRYSLSFFSDTAGKATAPFAHHGHRGAVIPQCRTVSHSVARCWQLVYRACPPWSRFIITQGHRSHLLHRQLYRKLLSPDHAFCKRASLCDELPGHISSPPT